jgi:autotransporter translocation and assembly factor TamB
VVTGHAEGGNTSISLNTSVALRDGILVATPVSLISGDNRIEGRVSWPLQAGFPEAQMNATLDDLGALAALAGFDVSGRVRATGSLQQEKVELDATLEGMRYGNLSLGKATVRGRATRTTLLQQRR